MYVYGNFCGPGHPFPERDPSNLKKAAAIEPVDSIDRGCKFHDMCYMKFGVDSPACDDLIYAAEEGNFANLPMPLYVQCQKQAAEIMNVMFKTKDYGERIVKGGVMVLALPLGGVVNGLAGLPDKGFPKEAGHCWNSYNRTTRGNANKYVQPNSSEWIPEDSKLWDGWLAKNSRGLARQGLLGQMTGLGQLAGGHYTGLIGRNDTLVDVERFLHTGELVALKQEYRAYFFGDEMIGNGM